MLPYRRLRAGDLYKEALDEWKSRAGRPYELERVVAEFEQWVRIPQFFERILTEAQLDKLREKAKADAQRVPDENREFALRITQEFVEALTPYYGTILKPYLENLQRYQRELLLLSDMHRAFADNPAGFVQFFGAVMAASFPREELEKLRDWPKAAGSLCKLLVRSESAPEPEGTKTLPQLPMELGGALQLLAAGRGLSLDSLRRLAAMVGLDIGGRPGRTPKDYSLEYNLKASGLSWAKVAMRALLDDPELREEFGGRGYDSLDYRQREALKHRIREGVKSYARREGKPFPPQAETAPTATTKGEPENSRNPAIQKNTMDKLPS